MMIGVVAGVGPFAGLDLLNKIATQTVAESDQDHLTVASLSQPSAIPDRTAFLVGQTQVNPAGPILHQLRQLEQIGALVAGIPCNTAHAVPIMDVIKEGLAASGSPLRLLHMIDEVGRVLQRRFPAVQRVGVLSTIGTAYSRVYPATLEPLGYKIVDLNEHVLLEMVHPAIYDVNYGIKARGYINERARKAILLAIEHLKERGAEAVVLGCTELPLMFSTRRVDDLPLIDSTLVLARALIRAVNPAKLLPWENQRAG